MVQAEHAQPQESVDEQSANLTCNLSMTHSWLCRSARQWSAAPGLKSMSAPSGMSSG